MIPEGLEFDMLSCSFILFIDSLEKILMLERVREREEGDDTE